MPTSVRLDAKTESRVNQLAKRTGRTKSQVIREAITRLAEDEEKAWPGRTACEAMKHLIGIAGRLPLRAVLIAMPHQRKRRLPTHRPSALDLAPARPAVVVH